MLCIRVEQDRAPALPGNAFTGLARSSITQIMLRSTFSFRATIIASKDLGQRHS